MDTKQFGAFLSGERKAKGMTQKDLAEKLGVTDKAVSKWERGICLPDVAKFDDIADALDLTDLEVLRAKRLPPQTPLVIPEEVPPLVAWKECGVLLSGCLAAALLCYPGQVLELAGVLKILQLSSLCQCALCAAFGIWYAWRRAGQDTRFGWRRVGDCLLILFALGAAFLLSLDNFGIIWEFPQRLFHMDYTAGWEALLDAYGWSPRFLLYHFLCWSVFDILPVSGLFLCFAAFPCVKLSRIFFSRGRRAREN